VGDAIQVNESGLVLYLVLFDTSLESESVALYSKFKKKNESHVWMDLLLGRKIKYKINQVLQRQ
jgi:hypothetical protein